MPFTRTTASADTCVLSDFIAVGHLELLWRLFLDGIWTDSGIVLELQDRFGSSVVDELRACACELLIERSFQDRHYFEMAEIKARRPTLRHPDIACVVVAGMHGATCLSSDAAVRRTCKERSVFVAGHVGCLQEAVARRLIDSAQAIDLLDRFLVNGLYLLPAVVSEFREEMWKSR